MPITVDLHPALRKLADLPFSSVEAGGRYVSSNDADQCAWVDDFGDICKVRFANVRRNALPLQEEGGQLKDLNLAADASLYEASHLCRFPGRIVGVEFNVYGPRPSRLAPYLRRAVGQGCPEFALEALLRQDVARRPAP